MVDADSPQMKLLEDVCRANLESSVRDPVLREKLRPNYRAACKRLIISSDFYQAIQKPNAELVTEGIERIEAGGVRTRDGRLHELDVLVLATGFRVDRFLRPIEVVGKRRGSDSKRCGRSGRSRISRSRSRAFRTCSCSTARTVPSATSR